MNTQSINLAELYDIDQFIDTFALGHYARVVNATDRRTGEMVAFKVLRPEHLTPNNNGEIRWEYRAFPSEADLLTRLNISPHVVHLRDCGYLESGEDAPHGGAVVSYGKDVPAFSAVMTDYAAMGWRPYLALENLPRTHNLLYLMKPSKPDVRWRLPTEEGLALAWQFAHLLKLSHSQKIVYLDHKLEHVYWDGARLRVIDLNSSRLLDDSVNHESYFRMDVHNLCVGILYPIFTGLSPQKASLRPQPSSMNEVEARYRDVSALDFGIEPTLSPALRDLLQAGAEQRIDTADTFIDLLRDVAELHGWDFPNRPIAPDCRVARDQMRQGLKKLREGQDAIRAARDLFREAAILDGITQDQESELRRLVRAVSDMLNERVIP